MVKNNIFLTMKDSVICPLCSNILINPFMCNNCQYVYCKKCIDEWLKNNNECPNGQCKKENPEYKENINTNNILLRLKFECNKCGNEFLYEEVKKHADNCKSTHKKEKAKKFIDNSNAEKHKLKRLNNEQLEKKKDIPKIKSKKNSY